MGRAWVAMTVILVTACTQDVRAPYISAPGASVVRFARPEIQEVVDQALMGELDGDPVPTSTTDLLHGALGDVRFSDRPHRTERAGYGTLVETISSFVYGPDGEAMVALIANLPLDSPALAPGFSGEYSVERPSLQQFGVLGCSGPPGGPWAFDQLAYFVTVDVFDGPDENHRTMEFTAEFIDSGPVWGQVTYALVPTGDYPGY